MVVPEIQQDYLVKILSKKAKQQINEKVVCLESIMGQLPLIPQTAPNDNNDRSVKVNMGNKDVLLFMATIVD